MISKKCKYAIRAILYLALESNETEKKGLRQISSALQIPGPYLGRVLQELASKSVIASAKGPNGGFYLTEVNLEASLLRIVEAIDGLDFFNACALGLPECSASHPCPIHDSFKKSREQLKQMFNSKTVQSLASEVRSGGLFLVGRLD